MNFNALPLLMAFIVTLILTPIIRRIAIRLKILDHPDKRKIHGNPIPLLGSISVYVGLLIALIFPRSGTPLHGELLVIFLTGTFLLFIGILDDCGFIHPQIKLMIGMPVAALIMIFFDLHLKVFPNNLLNYFFTLFWIVGITAAYNLLDGMDGLSTGICIIASFFYLIFGMFAKDFALILLSSSLIGTCFAFLIFNFHPARIFLGDGGAIFLGFLLASMGLRVANNESFPVLTRWMVPILILAVPIFDTSLITFSRMRRGLIPFLYPGKDHSHHRLYNLGLGQRKTVLLIYLFGITSGLFSLLIYRLNPSWGYLIFSLLILSGLALLIFFEKLPFEKQEIN